MTNKMDGGQKSFEAGREEGALEDDALHAAGTEQTHVVADMSDLPARPSMFVPSFEAMERRKAAQKEAPQDKPPVDLDADDVKTAVKGALGAALLLWLVYAVAFGVFIFVLTKLFKLV